MLHACIEQTYLPAVDANVTTMHILTHSWGSVEEFGDMEMADMRAKVPLMPEGFLGSCHSAHAYESVEGTCRGGVGS